METKKNVQILCIDDDADIRFALGELFSVQGWKTEEAASVAEGLELFRANEPDIVLIDYHMPGINGVEGVRLLRTFSKTVPIIVFTIDENQEVADQFLEAGATDFALKPVKAPDIISRINLHLRLLERQERSPRPQQLDKGMSDGTMEIVTECMRHSGKEDMSLDEIAEASGLAYQTAHRYLSYLVRTGQAEQINIYGKKGRPKLRYCLRPKY